MMRDHPQGADLLAEARRVLTETVLPQLSSGARYQALMVIRSITLAENELCSSAETEKQLGGKLTQFVDYRGTETDITKNLATQIRSGKIDASAELYAFLRQVVAFKLNETNPSKIDASLED